MILDFWKEFSALMNATFLPMDVSKKYKAGIWDLQNPVLPKRVHERQKMSWYGVKRPEQK